MGTKTKTPVKRATTKRTSNTTRAKRARKSPGIGTFCRELLVKGKSTKEVLVAVTKRFPDASTSPGSVAWYRSKLRSEGKL